MGLFRFKQFSVDDTGASLKVGTDAVLLGAWSNVTGSTRLLDIGTGSGIIALMLAQRSAADAHIDAVEINPEDVKQAEENVRQSPWQDKITILEGPIQNHYRTGGYDRIVCNPPYFTQSLLSPHAARTTARHDIRLPQAELIQAVERLLAPEGLFAVILPASNAAAFTAAALSKGLHLIRHTRFYSRSEKPQERSLLEFGRNPGLLHEDRLVLYAEGNNWSAEYVQLTRAFYL